MAGTRIDELRAELEELDRIAAGPGGLTSAGEARRERARVELREAEDLEASLPAELRAENLTASPPAEPSADLPGESVAEAEKAAREHPSS